MEFDCAKANRHGCEWLKSESTSSFVLFKDSSLIDVYYGPLELEFLRNYCLVQVGFKNPRSLSLSATDAKPKDEFNTIRLNAENFDDAIKDKLTFVL